MSEAVFDTMKLSNSSETKSFDICWESDEEMLLEHYGLSAIKKSSGVICLMCMKFFLDEISAQEHARNLFHYQHYNIALDEIGKDCGVEPHIVGAFYGSEYSYEEDCFDSFSTSAEFEENMRNNELVTIRKCYGTLCSACRKFFVNEVSAGLHVKSLAHYRKCFDGTEKDATPKKRGKEEKITPRSFGDLSSCMEIEPNDCLHPELILQNGDKPDCLDVPWDMKHVQKNNKIPDAESLEEGEIEDGDSEGSALGSVSSMDNDWWHDLDDSLATLLHDIHNDI